jgi:hypothetical protein
MVDQEKSEASSELWDIASAALDARNDHVRDGHKTDPGYQETLDKLDLAYEKANARWQESIR